MRLKTDANITNFGGWLPLDLSYQYLRLFKEMNIAKLIQDLDSIFTLVIVEKVKGIARC